MVCRSQLWGRGRRPDALGEHADVAGRVQRVKPVLGEAGHHAGRLAATGADDELVVVDDALAAQTGLLVEQLVGNDPALGVDRGGTSEDDVRVRHRLGERGAGALVGQQPGQHLAGEAVEAVGVVGADHDDLAPRPDGRRVRRDASGRHTRGG